ncbi:MAG: acylneuraminate cytidylyltransferase family protein [Peptococcaceae bacterium]|nr:acylneuraminate cytidylyltransferase family protein [Peptococcaceae bacterium]
MIDGKSVLAVIPARGGSRGVPRKNIRMVAGKPLIAWTIEEAKKSLYIDRLVLSSEDEEIIAVARSWGCEAPFVRPPELAGDDTPGIEPVLHALKIIPGYDYVVVLQPTSPMRTAGDIDGCIEQCVRQGSGACVSVTEPDKSPYWMYVLGGGNRMKPLIAADINISRRQDLPRVYVLNGAVYVARCEWLLKTRTFLHEETTAFPMDKLNSIDIDNELDIRVCEMLLSKL